jgi:hypothetical protein
LNSIVSAYADQHWSGTANAQKVLLDMILEGCIPYAKEVAKSGESEDEEDEVLEPNEATSTGLPKTMACIPEVLFKVLRFIMMMIVTVFRTYVRPYIQSDLFEPSPLSNVEESLQHARKVLKQLEEISLSSVSERIRLDVLKEITLIEKSVNRIEEISQRSL